MRQISTALPTTVPGREQAEDAFLAEVEANVDAHEAFARLRLEESVGERLNDLTDALRDLTDVVSGKASRDHSHPEYAAARHDHSQYADRDHNHDSRYTRRALSYVS